jgi:murein DD-endopeptidase MepM/ murein hydrolase activator NlpD
MLLVGFLYFKPISPQIQTLPAVRSANNGQVSDNAIIKNSSDGLENFNPPLQKSGDRVTKKYFGIYIAPKNSPIQPEKFQGYHTGSDFEIFPEEFNIEVPVRAICSGKIKVKKSATGYGGVIVESCELDNQPVTIIYAHLKLSSVVQKIGDSLKIGDVIGILGANQSVETSGERKHLHLGIHKGTDINILGYVQSKRELSSWIDPCLYVCHN